MSFEESSERTLAPDFHFLPKLQVVWVLLGSLNREAALLRHVRLNSWMSTKPGLILATYHLE